MGNRTFLFGDIRIREVRGSYYVYFVEKGQDRKMKEIYVGPLADMVKTYLKLKDKSGVSPTWARRDLNSGLLPCEGSVLTRLDYGPNN